MAKSWLLALTIFSVIVVVSTTPSVEEHTHTRSDKTIQIDSKPKHTTQNGEVVVECQLETPYDSTSPAHGPLHITVHKSISPLASDAFLKMVESEHFNGCYLFRVVKGFIVQWGIESPRPDGQKARVKFEKVGIDNLVTGKSLANIRGSLNFAGGNSQTGQVYVNLKNNSHLDKEPGSLPFAMLDDKSMEILQSVFDGYNAGMGQVKAVKKGPAEVENMFPKMSRIEVCRVIDSDYS